MIRLRDLLVINMLIVVSFIAACSNTNNRYSCYSSYLNYKLYLDTTLYGLKIDTIRSYCSEEIELRFISSTLEKFVFTIYMGPIRNLKGDDWFICNPLFKNKSVQKDILRGRFGVSAELQTFKYKMNKAALLYYYDEYSENIFTEIQINDTLGIQTSLINSNHDQDKIKLEKINRRILKGLSLVN